MADRRVVRRPLGLIGYLWLGTDLAKKPAQAGGRRSWGDRHGSMTEMTVPGALPLKNGLCTRVVGGRANGVRRLDPAHAFAARCTSAAPVQTRDMAAGPLGAHDHLRAAIGALGQD